MFTFVLLYILSFSGIFCSCKIPDNTFFDEEDGDTRNLNLTLTTTDDSTRQWLYLDDDQQHLIGISLKIGSFQYRLDARDSADQMTSTAFEVRVIDDDASHNHQFIITLDQSIDTDKLLNVDPTTIVTFVRRLANAVASDRDPAHITVGAIGANPTTIEWYNNTLSTTV
jgi:neurexin